MCAAWSFFQGHLLGWESQELALRRWHGEGQTLIPGVPDPLDSRLLSLQRACEVLQLERDLADIPDLLVAKRQPVSVAGQHNSEEAIEAAEVGVGLLVLDDRQQQRPLADLGPADEVF